MRPRFASAAFAALLCTAAAAHDLRGVDAERRLAPDAAAPPPVRNWTDDKRLMMRSLVERGAVPYSVFIDPDAWAPGTVLKVCFYLPGEAEVKKWIVKYASRWSEFGNIRFDFGSAPQYRVCQQAADPSQIRISFSSSGYRSAVGKRALLTKPDQATMSLQSIHDPDVVPPPPNARFEYLVTHEFGHAVGLAHEYQNPSVHCMQQFDVDAIRTHYNWSEEDAKLNLQRIDVSNVFANGSFFNTGTTPDGQQVTFTPFDRGSVMLYDLKPTEFKSPPGDCYSGTLSSQPSPIDQAAIKRAYPMGNPLKVVQTHNAFIENALANKPLSDKERNFLRSMRRSLDK